MDTILRKAADNLHHLEKTKGHNSPEARAQREGLEALRKASVVAAKAAHKLARGPIHR
jgi:hypothetical protein